ncbi:MAG TPA: hypothetical protein VLB44_11595 [Kofleriaceae bacterium]|nr:hypothetical protein [Kofleriaceae bacterium]
MYSRIALLVTLTGCGSSSPGDPVEIIGRDWTVPAGTETYKCIGIQVDHDMYINKFQTENPLGEHHAVLTVTDQLGGLGGTQLGEYDCTVLTLDLQMLFASGVGTDSLAMPDGVALPVKAGQFLNLNLHLFNTTDAPIAAHSGIIATPIDPVDEAHQAEMVFTGTFNIDVPPAQTVTTGGGCTFTRDAKIFTYWPHMHQHATHQTVTLTQGGVPRTLHDSPFDFMEQKNYELTPMIDVHAGDSIRTDCTYTNSSTATLTFGDSSTKEMCFTGLYRYPKQAFSLFDCTEGHP